MTLIELDDIKKNYKVIEIAVDFINPSYNVSRAKRLDTARYVICTLTENGIPRGVKDTEAARIRLQKPDRTYVYNDCDVLEDGRVFITLTEQILAVEGNAVCDIQLVDEETGIIYSTKNFIINIDKTAVDNSVMASTNEFDALNKLIATNKKINDELKANEEIRQANEFERIENETCREENEADRQNDEAERVNAENTRSINENQRIENEDIRKSNEAVRQDNETNRQINSNVAVLNAEKATEKANDAANNLQNKLDSHYFVLSEDKGIANGIAELDSNGLILSRQLPSYVDDVIEGFLYNNKFYKETEHITEIIGETGKIYVDLDSNKTYRWSGSSFTVISETIALGETSSTAYRGDRGKIAYEHSQASHAPSDAEVNQNTFSNVVVGNSAITANSKTDTLTLVEGNNITLIPDAINNKITISSSNEALGSSTVGSSTTPIYLNNGVPTVCEDIINDSEASDNHTYSSDKIEEYITNLDNEIKETQVDFTEFAEKTDNCITELKADKARFYNFTLTAKKTANIYSSTESSRLPTFMFAVTCVGPNTAILGSTFNSYPIIASQSKIDGLNITYASTDKRFYVFTNNKVDATTYLFTILATEDLNIEIVDSV